MKLTAPEIITSILLSLPVNLTDEHYTNPTRKDQDFAISPTKVRYYMTIRERLLDEHGVHRDAIRSY